MSSTRPVDTVTMPPRIAKLPRNAVGYPIPWFVATLPDGTRDFRIADQERHFNALKFGLCWICGQKTGANVAFTIGPMCAVNRISSEPPAHRDCAIYSARVCPFLANPAMRRRPHDVEGVVPAAGEPILRNPGVALVWVTRSYKTFRPSLGNAGYLCEIGDPTETLWFAEGRAATRAEITASIDSGLPALQDACQRDDDPATSLRMLGAQVAQALTLVPAS
jgi:hypothetical protein